VTVCAGYVLLLAFVGDDPAFVDGFEMGRLWARARTDTRGFTETLHARNAEMVLRIAEATGRAVRAEDLDETWIAAHFEAHEAPGTA
jgi:hypothetical protein